MCTVAVAFHVHPDYPVILASNRDERYARPSAAASFWEEWPDLLAGRDLEAGGTWLGVTRSGRFAVLTNIREGFVERDLASSRGELVTEYLTSTEAPLDFASALQEQDRVFNGYNLLLGDLEQLVYTSNRVDSAPRKLQAGIYALSNAVWGEDWPKTRRARALIKEVLDSEEIRSDAMLALLADTEQPPDDVLPSTGIELEWERRLAPIFIRTPEYGTCASTVFMVDRGGRAEFVERVPSWLRADGEAEVRLNFEISNL